MNILLIGLLCGAVMAIEEPQQVAGVRPLLGEKKCTWGPAYWCNSVDSANECSAIGHCSQHIWSKQEFQNFQDDPICGWCRKVVNDTKALVSNKKLQDEIKTFLLNECSVIPQDELVQLCKEYVSANIDALFKMLESTMNSLQICSTVGICVQEQAFMREFHSNSPIAPSKLTLMAVAAKSKVSLPITYLRDNVMPASNVPTCDTCKSKMDALKTKLKDVKSEAEAIKITMDGVCGDLMKPIEQMCRTKLKPNERSLYYYIKTHSADECCKLFQFCEHVEKPATPNTDKMPAVMQMVPLEPSIKKEILRRLKSQETCTICVLVIGEAQQLLKNDATEEEIQTVLDAVCAKLPSEISTTCTNFVNQYAVVVMQYITQLPANEVCKQIGLCDAAQLSGGKPALPMAELKPAVADGSVHTVALADATGGERTSEEGCYICRIIVNYLIGAINEKGFVDVTQVIVEKACDELPTSLADACKHIVENNLPEIIQAISQEMSTFDVCRKAAICPAIKNNPLFMNDKFLKLLEAQQQTPMGAGGL